MKKVILSLIIVFIFNLCALAQNKKVSVPLRFDHYYTYDQLVEAVKLLNKTYPNLTKLDLVGKSEENRDIWAITINNPKTGDALSKPGVYLDANIHGNELQAGEVCLYFTEYLLKNYGKIDKITKLVDKNAYYIIPSVNVDGRYHFFKDGNTMHSNRGLRRPKDDDKDGLYDEDFPDDLDGDGSICQMRKKVAYGKWKIDPDDPRLLKRVKKGEIGDWTYLGSEGIDNDGDGRINEDSEGYVDPNRNWGYHWQPNYVQHGAGDYPFSGVGLKAIAKYIMQRPNIIVVYAFHNYGGMFLRGPSSKDLGELHPRDIEVYDYLGEAGEKIVPGYRYLVSWKDLYPTYGDFTEFTTSIAGAYSFVAELFMENSETYSKKKKTEVEEPNYGGRRSRNNDKEIERLKYNDHLASGTLYKEWKPYKHPLYGDIEIGGWTKFSSRMPHVFMLPDLVHRNAMAVIFTAEQTPDVKMEIFEKKKIGKDLYRIRLRLINQNAIPSMSYHAVSKKLYPKDMLKISGNNIKVVAGGKLLDVYNDKVNYKEYKPELQFITVPGDNKVEYQFLVSGKGKFSIKYQSQKAGKLQIEDSI